MGLKREMRCWGVGRPNGQVKVWGSEEEKVCLRLQNPNHQLERRSGKWDGKRQRKRKWLNQENKGDIKHDIKVKKENKIQGGWNNQDGNAKVSETLSFV